MASNSTVPVPQYSSPTKNYSDPEWTAIVKALADRFDVNPEVASAAPHQILPDTYVTDFLKCDVGRRSAPLQSLSSQLDISAANNLGIPYQHVEPVIKETGRLLDRALGTDREYFRVGVEWFNLRLELCRFFALDSINQAEIDAQIYKLPFLEADADLTVLNLTSATNSKLDAGFATPDVQNSLAVDLTRAQGIAYDLAVNPLLLSNGTGPGGASKIGGQGSVADCVGHASAAQVAATFPLQRALGQAEVTKQSLNTESTNARKASLEAKRRFYEQDSTENPPGFKASRRNVEVGINQAKYDAMSVKNGFLNYSNRMEMLLKRQQADMIAAYSRILAIDNGSRLIYNLTPPPLPSPTPINLDECVNCLRALDNALAQSARLDQQYVCRVTLKDILPAGNFATGLTSGKWSFRLPLSRFQGQRLLRLRGVAIYAVDNSGENFYDIDVMVPTADAECIYGAGVAKPVPQDNVPPCWFRGAGSRRNVHRPEITGGDALFNCTPIGTWIVRLIGDLGKAKDNGLSDLQLDIHVAAQKDVGSTEAKAI